MTDDLTIPETAHTLAGGPRTTDDSSSPPSARRAPSRSLRWVVALLTTLVMLVATTGVAVVAQAGSAGAGPTFLPSGAVAYAEARLDLPGEQRDQLMAFLAHFPGFADASTFELKLEQGLDQVTGGSAAAVVYSRDIKPWSNGVVAVGLEAIPADMTNGSSPPLVTALGVADRGKLDAALPTLLGAMGGQQATEAYAGTTITTVTPKSGQATSVAATDTWLLLSPDPAALRTSLDVLAGSQPSLASDVTFESASASVPAEHLGAFYVDGAQLRDALVVLLGQAMSSQPPAAANQLAGVLQNLPDWITGAIHVDADHLTAELAAKPAEGAPPMSVRQTDLAAFMPADTLAYIEVRDLGSIVDAFLGTVKAQLTSPKELDQVAAIEGLLDTTLDRTFEPAQDAALGVSLDGTELQLGLVVTLTDEALAKERYLRIMGAVGSLAAAADSPVSISTSKVGDVKVTTITADEGVIPPEVLGVPIATSLSVAVADGHLYLGSGDFVAQALQRDPADALSSNERFGTALASVTPENGGFAWVDMAGLAAAIEAVLAPSQQAAYEASLKPWVDHLDYAVAAADQADGISSLKILLYVR